MDIFAPFVSSMTLSNWLSVVALVISLWVGLLQTRQRRQQIRLQEQLLLIQVEEASRKTFTVEVVRPRVLRHGKESDVLIIYPIFGLSIPSDSSDHPDEIQFDLVLRNGSALPVNVEDAVISGLTYQPQSGSRRLLNRLWPDVGTSVISMPLREDTPTERFQLSVADAASGSAIALDKGLTLGPSSVMQLRLIATPLPALIERLDQASLGIVGLTVALYLADDQLIARTVSLPEAWKGRRPWWPLGFVHLAMNPPPQRHVFHEKYP